MDGLQANLRQILRKIWVLTMLRRGYALVSFRDVGKRDKNTD
jgi:hypothetical protein